MSERSGYFNHAFKKEVEVKRLLILVVSLLSAASIAHATDSVSIETGTGTCLDALSWSKNAGSALGQYACSVDATNQKFEAKVGVDGSLSFVNLWSGLCLDIASGSTADGAGVVQSTCTGSASQKLSPMSVGGGRYALVMRHSGKCIGLPSGSGSQFEQSACSTGNTKQSLLFRVSSGSLSFLSPTATVPAVVSVRTFAGMCWDALSWAKTAGSAIGQYTCNNAGNQQFKTIMNADGSFTLINQWSNLCLDVYGASTADGAKVVQEVCNSAKSQKFGVVDLGDGSFQLVAKHSGKCLRSPDSKAMTQLEQGACNRASAQAVGFKVVSGSLPLLTSRIGVAAGSVMTGLTDEQLSAYLGDLNSLGAGWIRFDVPWNLIQAHGTATPQWTRMDAVMKAIRDHGLKSIGTLAYTPPWARPAGSTDKHPPTQASDFANFTREVVKRYGALGHKHWEIWNEMNVPSFWSTGADPAQYTNLLKAAYPAIKGADPEAIVLTGGLSPAADAGTSLTPPTFLKKMYEAGAAGFFDGVSNHPYCWPNRPSAYAAWSSWSQMSETATSLRSLMIARGDSDKKVWITEMGAPTSGASSQNPVSEDEQARMLQDAWNVVRSSSWIGPMNWYQFQDRGTDTGNREDFFGLKRFDGTPKAAYRQYMNLAK